MGKMNRIGRDLSILAFIVGGTLLASSWAQSPLPSHDDAYERVILEINYRNTQCEIVTRHFPGLSPWDYLNGELHLFEDLRGKSFYELLLMVSTPEEKDSVRELMKGDWTNESHLQSVRDLAFKIAHQ